VYVFPKQAHWYKDLTTQDFFEVIFYSREEDFIEVQYEHGEIGSFSYDDWSQLSLIPVHEPLNWSSVWEVDYDDRDHLFGEVSIPDYTSMTSCFKGDQDHSESYR
jgi:hypothetical protein